MRDFFISESGAVRPAVAISHLWCAVSVLAVAVVLGVASPAAASFDCPLCGGCNMNHGDHKVTTCTGVTEICTQPPYNLETHGHQCFEYRGCTVAAPDHRCMASCTVCVTDY
jgi:hypothetical protein